MSLQTVVKLVFALYDIMRYKLNIVYVLVRSAR